VIKKPAIRVSVVYRLAVALCLCSSLSYALGIDPSAASETVQQAGDSRAMGPATWSYRQDGRQAGADLAASSDCRSDCNDEVDYQSFISIDCTRGEGRATLLFSGLGEDSDAERRVKMWIEVDGQRTHLNAEGNNMMDGVGLRIDLPLTDPLFHDLASGDRLRYGTEAGRIERGSLHGSGKAIRLMLQACR